MFTVRTVRARLCESGLDVTDDGTRNGGHSERDEQRTGKTGKPYMVEQRDNRF